MAGPTFDTMSISDVSYESGVLTLKITTGYGMKNPDFTITPTGKTPIAVSRSGYLSNPYTLTLTTSGVAAGDTCTIDATYMDSADSGTSLTANANFTIPAALVPTADLSIRATPTAVNLTATSTTAGAGSVNIRIAIYADSAMTSLLHQTNVHTIVDGGSWTWSPDYDTYNLDPGTTYYVKVVKAGTTDVMDTGQFTVPHYTTKVFKEWQKDGVRYDFTTPVTEDITLVGVWNESYQVTFKDADNTVLSVQNVVQGSDYGLIMPPDPSYATEFVGWECSLDGHIWDNATESVISEMTLTAKYNGVHQGGSGA